MDFLFPWFPLILIGILGAVAIRKSLFRRPSFVYYHVNPAGLQRGGQRPQADKPDGHLQLAWVVDGGSVWGGWWGSWRVVVWVVGAVVDGQMKGIDS